jgi:myosin heavy subunit
VRHYAGDVSYDVTGFLDKNRDTLQDELLDLLYDSNNSFIGDQLYGEGKQEREEIRKDKGGTRKKSSITVAQKFKDQLTALVQTLTNTVPHYVRCLKPNSQKKPDLWDPELVLAQLRYSGMLETIRIRRLGYPIRYTVKDFWDRYIFSLMQTLIAY